jgi:hypothetical protein
MNLIKFDKVFIFQARISPMIAPYIADLSVYHEKLPLMVFGSAALIAG